MCIKFILGNFLLCPSLQFLPEAENKLFNLFIKGSMCEILSTLWHALSLCMGCKVLLSLCVVVCQWVLENGSPHISATMSLREIDFNHITRWGFCSLFYVVSRSLIAQIVLISITFRTVNMFRTSIDVWLYVNHHIAFCKTLCRWYRMIWVKVNINQNVL